MQVPALGVYGNVSEPAGGLGGDVGGEGARWMNEELCENSRTGSDQRSAFFSIQQCQIEQIPTEELGEQALRSLCICDFFFIFF